MKSGLYTTTLPIELEFEINNGDDIIYKEFEIEFSANWQNDGIGWTEAWGARSFHKGNSYLEQLDNWKILDDVTEGEKVAIEEYIDKNEDEILEQMASNYHPYWNLPY